ncbi:MAG TPA: hypothetical protein VI037_06840 [Nitrososphaera sp.]
MNAALAIGVTALSAIVAVTFLSMTFLQEFIDIFYTATINAIVVAAIIIGAAISIHRKLARVI